MTDEPLRPLLSDDVFAERRVARQELERLEEVEAAARHLDHLISLGPPGLPRPTTLIEQITARRLALSRTGEGPLPARQRPKQRFHDRWDPSRQRALVSIDETGLTKGHDAAYPFFAVAAVIIASEDVPLVESELRKWQEATFGQRRYVHELDVRKRRGAFYFGGDLDRQSAAEDGLRRLLDELPYRVTAVVLDKERFRIQHPDGRVDGALPVRLYPMVVHMLFERVVHCLWLMGDRKGDLEAEGVGEVEDAYLQQAIAALKISGTRFQSEMWFRYQLADHVSFFGKTQNRAGLQLADWVVKPLADAARAARSSGGEASGLHHRMWSVIRPHLYDGEPQNRPDTFGLKVYPGLSHDERTWLFPETQLDPARLATWEPESSRAPRPSLWDP